MLTFLPIVDICKSKYIRFVIDFVHQIRMHRYSYPLVPPGGSGCVPLLIPDSYLYHRTPSTYPGYPTPDIHHHIPRIFIRTCNIPRSRWGHAETWRFWPVILHNRTPPHHLRYSHLRCSRNNIRNRSRLWPAGWYVGNGGYFLHYSLWVPSLRLVIQKPKRPVCEDSNREVYLSRCPLVSYPRGLQRAYPRSSHRGPRRSVHGETNAQSPLAQSGQSWQSH